MLQMKHPGRKGGPKREFIDKEKEDMEETSMTVADGHDKEKDIKR